MRILGKEIKAVIFDMDGTLIDSTGIWAEIDKEFFAKRNKVVPPDYAKEVVHQGLDKAAVMTKERYGFKETPEEIILEWREASIAKYRDEIPLKEGAEEFLKYLKRNNIKTAIATANDEELYKPCLERLGIGNYFDFITDVRVAKEGKSSPRIFDLINEKFGVSKEETMVIEDTSVAVKTAYLNGYFTVAMFDKQSASYSEEIKANSHHYIHSFKELME